jgi:hypothetical protein
LSPAMAAAGSCAAMGATVMCLHPRAHATILLAHTHAARASAVCARVPLPRVQISSLLMSPAQPHWSKLLQALVPSGLQPVALHIVLPTAKAVALPIVSQNVAEEHDSVLSLLTEVKWGAPVVMDDDEDPVHVLATGQPKSVICRDVNRHLEEVVMSCPTGLAVPVLLHQHSSLWTHVVKKLPTHSAFTALLLHNVLSRHTSIASSPRQSSGKPQRATMAYKQLTHTALLDSQVGTRKRLENLRKSLKSNDIYVDSSISVHTTLELANC